VDFATGDVRNMGIEQRGQIAQDTAFGLAAQSEQNEIMTGENGVDDLRYYRVVVSHNAGKNGPALAKLGDEIVAHFVLHAPRTQPLFAEKTVAQFAERGRKTHDQNPRKKAISELDYTPLTRRSESRRPAYSMQRPEFWGSMNVAIAARLLPHPHRPPQIRQDRFEVGNDCLHPFRF
jgi:hypothetical protein